MPHAFRRSAWRKRTFVRIFFATLLVAFVILSTSSLIYYRDLEDITVEQVQKSGIESLSRAKSVFAAIHLWLMSTVRELRNDPAIERILTSDGSSSAEIGRSLNTLNDALDFYRWIDSIYIYNSRADLMLSTVRGVEQGRYSDLDLRQLLLNPVRPQPYEYFPRAIRSDVVSEDGRTLPSGGRRNVWTLIVDDTAEQPVDPQAWLVVNIREDRIREDFFAQFMQTGDEFFVIERNGTVVSHPDESLFRINIAGRSLVSHIIGRPQPEGSFELRSAGSTMVVSYVTYEELDWYLISITSYDDFMAPVDRVRRVSLLLFGGFLLLAGLLAFVFSRRIYSPIDRLMGFAVKVRGQLPPEIGAQVQPSKGELQFLSEMFQRVADQATQLNRAQERFQAAHMEELLRQLLEGRLTADNAFSAEQLVGLRHDNGFLVLVVRLDNYARIIREFQSSEIRSIFQRLARFMAEYIPFDHHLVDMGDDHGAIIVGYHVGEQEPAILQVLSAQVNHMLSEFHARFKWSLTVGISSETTELDDLPDAYQEALEATRLRFRLGHGCVIEARLLRPDAERRTYSFPEETVRMMLYAVQKGELADAVSSLHGILEEVRDYEPEDFSVLLQFTKYMSLKMLDSKRKASVGSQVDAVRMIESVDAVETVEQAEQLLAEAYRLYTNGMAASHSQETVELVESIKSIVMERIEDPNLCPDLLADEVRLSTNHVRRVFKEYTGISLSAFITNERISRCQNLLIETDLTVKEIYRQAGFSNYSNFFTTFKRITGQTPGDYRESHSLTS